MMATPRGTRLKPVREAKPYGPASLNVFETSSTSLPLNKVRLSLLY